MRNRHWFDILALGLLIAAGSVLGPMPSRSSDQASVVWGSITAFRHVPADKGGR